MQVFLSLHIISIKHQKYESNKMDLERMALGNGLGGFPGISLYDWRCW